MKVYVVLDEAWPDYHVQPDQPNYQCHEIDATPEQVERWARIRKDYDERHEEIRALLEP